MIIYHKSINGFMSCCVVKELLKDVITVTSEEYLQTIQNCIPLSHGERIPAEFIRTNQKTDEILFILGLGVSLEVINKLQEFTRRIIWINQEDSGLYDAYTINGFRTRERSTCILTFRYLENKIAQEDYTKEYKLMSEGLDHDKGVPWYLLYIEDQELGLKKFGDKSLNFVKTLNFYPFERMKNLLNTLKIFVN